MSVTASERSVFCPVVGVCSCVLPCAITYLAITSTTTACCGAVCALFLDRGQATGVSTYDKPDELKSEAEKALPPCPWQEFPNPATGRQYYYNKNTKESVWEEPAELRDYKLKLAALERGEPLPVTTPAAAAAPVAAAPVAAPVAAAATAVPAAVPAAAAAATPAAAAAPAVSANGTHTGAVGSAPTSTSTPSTTTAAGAATSAAAPAVAVAASTATAPAIGNVTAASAMPGMPPHGMPPHMGGMPPHMGHMMPPHMGGMPPHMNPYGMYGMPPPMMMQGSVVWQACPTAGSDSRVRVWVLRA